MATYRVRVTKEVTDTLDAIVEVKARNEAGAMAKALKLAKAGKLEFHFAYAAGEDLPEADSAEKIEG